MATSRDADVAIAVGEGNNDASTPMGAYLAPSITLMGVKPMVISNTNGARRRPAR
jgi:hypothetical protein